MTDEWVRVATKLGSLREVHARNALKRSRLQWRWTPAVRGKDLELRLDDEASGPYGILQELVDLNKMVFDAAAAEGLEIRPYKPLEEEVVIVAAEVALREADDMATLIAALLHELVWAQGLPNANHRTAFALLVAVLESDGVLPPDPQLLHDIAEDFAVASKPLILEKEFAPVPDDLKPRHRAAAETAAERIMAAVQSRT